MNELEKTGFAERQKSAMEAKKALLAKFRPKPTVTDPLAHERDAIRAADLAQLRQGHAEAKAAAKQAVADAKEALRQAQADIEAAELDAKRGVRKERKALTKAEAKAKRDSRYAARKARQ